MVCALAAQLEIDDSLHVRHCHPETSRRQTLSAHEGMAGPVGYWQVDNIKQGLRLLLDAGAEAQQEVKDVGGGKLIASVKDASSNIIGLMQLP
jgi:hypothetical protein